MNRSLFRITGGGKTTLCSAEDFGNLAEQLALLSKVSKAKERTPTLNEHSWLLHHLDKAHGLRPLCTSQKLALFQPMLAEDYTKALQHFEEIPNTSSHTVWDYDNDFFVFSEWHDDRRLLVSGPLSDAVSTYESTLRHLNSSQSYLNVKDLERRMSVVCTIIEIENELENGMSPTMQL